MRTWGPNETFQRPIDIKVSYWSEYQTTGCDLVNKVLNKKEHDSLSIKRNSDSLFVKNKGICLVYKKEIHGDPGDLFLVLELCLVRTSYFRFEAAWHGHGIKVFLVIMNSSSTNTVRLRSKVSVFNKKTKPFRFLHYSCREATSWGVDSVLFVFFVSHL